MTRARGTACIGIDLAWGPKRRTGLAVLDPSGRLAESGSVLSDGAIVAFVTPHTDDAADGVVAAVDAPLVVPNETGRRACEAEVSRVFGQFHAGAHPSNRSRPWFVPEPRGARLAHRLGWSMDPQVRPSAGRGVAIEVYPHPAMVVLFGLDRVIPYKQKRGRDLSALRAAYGQLLGHMERVLGERLGLASSSRWGQIHDVVAAAQTKAALRRVEDEVDAIVCAHLAWLWANEPDRMAVIGDFATGYIVVPGPLPALPGQ
jgi:predicted RNase H-like nuclease